MTKYEVRENMRYNENLINSYSQNMRNCRQKIEQLERLRTKLDKLQNDFANRQNVRKNKLSNIESGAINLRVISTYCSGMKSLLNGQEYSNSYNGLSESKDRINAKIRAIQFEINSTNNDLRYRQDRYNYWRSQLQTATD